MKRVVVGVVLILLLGLVGTVVASNDGYLPGLLPSKAVSFLDENIKNVSNLERLGVPYQVRRNIPGVADAIIYRFDFEETKPLVPGEFDVAHYFTYNEMVYWLDRWNRENPGITEVISIGKSLEGRDLWLIAITNKETGHRTRKPAMYLSGGRHSGEVTAPAAAMDFAYKLLSGYGVDDEITWMIDNFVYYVQPMENPDGTNMYLETVLRNRSTNRPYDSNFNGIADEDIENDLNNDGYISNMRQYVGMGKGNQIIDPNDPSGRLMISVGAGKGDYLVHQEGIDVDGDGRINSDTIGGMDLHRQDSHAWRPMAEDTGHGYTQSGGSQHPYSEPEKAAMFQFLMANPNISVVQSMDTAVPMVLRGPSSSGTQESVTTFDQQYHYYLDQVGIETTGYPWAGDTHEIYMSRGLTGINPFEADMILLRQSDLLGHGLDFGLFQYGAVWHGDELWGNMRHEYLEDWVGKGRIEQNGLNALYAKDNIPGFERIFQEWEPFDHPDLGPVEIGGWNYKFWSQNPPPALLPQVVGRENNFNLALAKSLPKLDIVGMKVTNNGDGTKTITATIENTGILPDALKQAHMIKIIRRTQATLKLGPGLKLLPGETILHKHEIPIYGEAYTRETTNTATQILSYFAGIFEDDGNDTFYSKERGGPGPWQKKQEVSWIVEGSGTVEVEVRSTRGGWTTASWEVK